MADTKNLFLQVQGLDALHSYLTGISADFEPYMLAAMRNALVLIQSKAKAIGPGSFKNRTGNLRRSIQIDVRSATYGSVFTDQAYAAGVEMGTRPHIIVPVNKKALADKENGVIYGKLVHHPGSRPYPYMQPAMEQSADQILQQYADMFVAMAEAH